MQRENKRNKLEQKDCYGLDSHENYNAYSAASTEEVDTIVATQTQAYHVLTECPTTDPIKSSFQGLVTWSGTYSHLSAPDPEAVLPFFN